MVDVQVGHIDQFKFLEIFQVDYHLRNAGFLENQENNYERPVNSDHIVLKTQVEKIQKMKNTQIANTEKIDYNNLN